MSGRRHVATSLGRVTLYRADRTPVENSVSVKNYGRVESIEELRGFTDRLAAAPVWAGDIESGFEGPDREKGSLHPETAILVGISFTCSTDWARYVPLAHDVGENLDNLEVARLFWPLLQAGTFVAHNAAFELRHMAKWFREQLSDDPLYGEAVRRSRGYFPIRSDTQVEAYLVAEYPKFGLKYLTKEMFGHQMTELHELFENLPANRRKYLRFNVLELTPQVIEYACEDSVWCLAIHQKYYDKVKDTLLYKVELGIVSSVIPDMEDYGVRYDWPFMRRAADELREFRDKFNAEIMAELSELTGETVALNLASPPQIADMLFNKLGYRTTVYTATTRDLPPSERKMSTGSIALEALSKKYPVVKKILQWKEMTRLLGTYLDKYEGLYGYADDGNAHPNHMSAVVITGRFAVGDPAYQQSPKVYHYDLAPARAAHQAHAEAHGPKCACVEYPPPVGTCFRFNFRDAIIAPPDHYILGFDLSQAELRAIAGEAQETALLRAFANGEDVHKVTAALIYDIPIEDVTKDHRDVGKMIAFALGYGMSVKSLADRLARSVEEAQVLYDKYFAVYPNIPIWSQRQVQMGKTQGYVTSKFGRKLPIWEYQSDKRYIYQKGDRACVNYPVQGAATGDAVKIMMVRAHSAIQAAGLADKVHLVMNIHDALEWYVHKSVLPQDAIKVLQPAVIFDIPGWPAMKADWHIGKKWGSPMEIEVKDDGGLLVKGEKVYELVPAMEYDEETGEPTGALPEVDAEMLREVVAPRPTDTSRWVWVEVPEMPTEDGWAAFVELVKNTPGTNRLSVETPEGVIEFPQGTGVNPDHTARISVLLGPVKMTYDASDVDSAALVSDLTF